ncbi:MAG: hypothetical protein AB1898_13355 [Acidobacteriota bacterium]
MKINGYGILAHVRFLSPLLGILTGVWLLRLALDAGGCPHYLSRFVSVTTTTTAMVFVAALLIHFRGFGSYANMIMASLLLTTWAQLLVILAILFGVITGIENIYTAPEYSFPKTDPYHLRHIYGHLTFGIGLTTLFGSAVGCLLLWVFRKLIPMRIRAEGH